MSEPVMHSIEEAVGLTRLSRTTLYELMRAGRLTYCRIGRRRLIPVRALDELVALSTVAATAGQEERTCQS